MQDQKEQEQEQKQIQITYHLPKVPTPKVLFSIIGTDVACKFNRILQSIRLKRRPLKIDPESQILQIPQTERVRKATEIIRIHSPPFLFNHCIRTYLFGMCIANYCGELDKFDHEAFYFASLFHDMGLTDEGKKQFKDDKENEGKYGPDFELVGARFAQKYLKNINYDENLTKIVHEAIALHIAFGVIDNLGPEFNLVHKGAGVDVVGTHFDKVQEENMKIILKEYPREGFSEKMTQSMKQMIQESPGCIFDYDKNRTNGLFKAIKGNEIDNIKL